MSIASAVMARLGWRPSRPLGIVLGLRVVDVPPVAFGAWAMFEPAVDLRCSVSAGTLQAGHLPLFRAINCQPVTEVSLSLPGS